MCPFKRRAHTSFQCLDGREDMKKEDAKVGDFVRYVPRSPISHNPVMDGYFGIIVRKQIDVADVEWSVVCVIGERRHYGALYENLDKIELPPSE